jgi:hypothetical protein
MTDAALVEVSPNKGDRYPARAEAVIGREDCEIILADPEVSRRHAAIRVVPGGVGIEDLGSRNGTFVNDERIDGVRQLSAGDEVQVGETLLRFELAGADAPGPSPRGLSRGDVPALEIVPSVVRRAPPLEAAGPPAFTETPRRRIRGSAARRVEATVISYLIVLLTAIAVVAYLASR